MPLRPVMFSCIVEKPKFTALFCKQRPANRGRLGAEFILPSVRDDSSKQGQGVGASSLKASSSQRNLIDPEQIKGEGASSCDRAEDGISKYWLCGQHRSGGYYTHTMHHLAICGRCSCA